MRKRAILLLAAWWALPLSAAAQPAALEQLQSLSPSAAGSVPAVAPTAAFPREVRLRHWLFAHGDPLDVDHDRDGLHDETEAELSQAFRPWLIFDSHENANRPGEPVALFQVRPLGCVGPSNACGTSVVRLKVIYGLFWALDGGYGPASLFCRDRHIGDDQAVTVVLVSGDDGLSFRPESVHIGAWTWPTKSGAVEWREGTHFALYLSAGKHHHFFDARHDGRASPYSAWDCADSVDGKGASFASILRGNVGEPEAHPAPMVNALDARGFRGEDAWDTRPFCGGLACDRKDNPTSPASRLWARDAFRRP